MNSRLPFLPTVLLAAVAALTACSSPDGAQTPPATGSPAASSTTTSAPAATAPTAGPTATTSPSAPESGAAGPGADGAPATGVDGASEFEAVKTASGAMTAYTSAGLDAAAWHEGISAYTTPELAASLRGTDPASLRVSRVTGTPELALAESPTSVRVRVPTDAGEFSLGLTRADAASPAWKVAEIIPPE